MGSSGVCEVAGYPRTNRTARPSSARNGGATLGPPQRGPWQASQKAAGRCILPPLAENQDGNPGETMLASAQRLNVLRRQWWTRAAVCAALLFLRGAWASVSQAQD